MSEPKDPAAESSQADTHNPGDDPRPVSDVQLRKEVSRETVEGYRREADEAHQNWFSVMNNPYGKD